MKLSNKLLIGFIGGAFIYTSVAFTEVRLRAPKDGFNPLDAVDIEYMDINYLVVSDLDQQIFVRVSDTTRFELRSRVSILSDLDYEIKGDTLSLNSLDLEENTHFDLTVFVSPDFRGLQILNGNVQIANLEQEELSVNQEAGRLVLNHHVDIKRLSLYLKDAEVDAFRSYLDTIYLESENSSVEIRSAIDRIEGQMNDESYLYIESANDLDFKKDNSSTLRIR